MPVLNLLYEDHICIDEKIKIKIPTVGEILQNEDDYYSVISILTAMPIDFMVQLDDLGIDFSQISEYELFLRLFPCLQSMDTSLVFSGLDLNNFEYAQREGNDQVVGDDAIVLVDRIHDIVIDKKVYLKIAATLRSIHGIKKDIRTPANKEAKEYMIEVARRRQKRKRGRSEKSHLEIKIVALVNTQQYKYDFESTKGLTIYQFNESVKQIIKKIDYENRMIGVYSGTIKVSDMSEADLNWMIH